MAMTPKLELRQGQTLVMTPQLQQAIKLLQLSNIELTAFVQQELERNPLLDQAVERPAVGSEPTEERAPAAEASDGTSDLIGEVRASEQATSLQPDFEPADPTDSPSDRAGGEGEAMSGSLSMNGPVGAGGSVRFDDPD